MFKYVGQQCWCCLRRFLFDTRDEIISNAFEDIAYEKLIYFIIYILSRTTNSP